MTIVVSNPCISTTIIPSLGTVALSTSRLGGSVSHTFQLYTDQADVDASGYGLPSKCGGFLYSIYNDDETTQPDYVSLAVGDTIITLTPDLLSPLGVTTLKLKIEMENANYDAVLFEPFTVDIDPCQVTALSTVTIDDKTHQVDAADVTFNYATFV